MDQDIISKKDLLELTGISYGQLYRWKRKNLIPEEWFIRKSTFTGQETFFPREQILARIDKIKNMKEDLSLDEIADMFSPEAAAVSLGREDLLKRNIVSKVSLDLLTDQLGIGEVVPFDSILFGYIVEKLLQDGSISLEEGRLLLQTLADHYPKVQGKGGELIFVRKLGIATCLLHAGTGEVYVENGARIAARVNLASCIEELKPKLM
ncbi:YhbD family protein [Brevibacillus sp. SYP-B805]|uniref:DUF4004 family protein n=1 Tax=Brevibacillus sp. SYP-B805 TaxID=1578199 RepID=UPI0013EDB25C|nr:YhbD family protein [Brevibacillus sp. SYP-B805]